MIGRPPNAPDVSTSSRPPREPPYDYPPGRAKRLGGLDPAPWWRSDPEPSRPLYVLTIPGPLTEAETDEIRQRWQTETGTRALILQGGLRLTATVGPDGQVQLIPDDPELAARVQIILDDMAVDTDQTPATSPDPLEARLAELAVIAARLDKIAHQLAIGGQP